MSHRMAAEMIESLTQADLERIFGDDFDQNEIMKHHIDLYPVALDEAKWKDIQYMITFPNFIHDYIRMAYTIVLNPTASRNDKLEKLAIITALKIFSAPKSHLSVCIRECFAEILAVRTMSSGIKVGGEAVASSLASQDEESILNVAELYRAKEPLDYLLVSIKMMLNCL